MYFFLSENSTAFGNVISYIIKVNISNELIQISKKIA